MCWVCVVYLFLGFVPCVSVCDRKVLLFLGDLFFRFSVRDNSVRDKANMDATRDFGSSKIRTQIQSVGLIHSRIQNTNSVSGTHSQIHWTAGGTR